MASRRNKIRKNNRKLQTATPHSIKVPDKRKTRNRLKLAETKIKHNINYRILSSDKSDREKLIRQRKSQQTKIIVSPDMSPDRIDVNEQTLNRGVLFCEALKNKLKNVLQNVPTKLNNSVEDRRFDMSSLTPEPIDTVECHSKTNMNISSCLESEKCQSRELVQQKSPTSRKRKNSLMKLNDLDAESDLENPLNPTICSIPKNKMACELKSGLNNPEITMRTTHGQIQNTFPKNKKEGAISVLRRSKRRRIRNSKNSSKADNPPTPPLSEQEDVINSKTSPFKIVTEDIQNSERIKSKIYHISKGNCKYNVIISDSETDCELEQLSARRNAEPLSSLRLPIVSLQSLQNPHIQTVEGKNSLGVKLKESINEDKPGVFCNTLKHKPSNSGKKSLKSTKAISVPLDTVKSVDGQPKFWSPLEKICNYESLRSKYVSVVADKNIIIEKSIEVNRNQQALHSSLQKKRKELEKANKEIIALEASVKRLNTTLGNLLSPNQIKLVLQDTKSVDWTPKEMLTAATINHLSKACYLFLKHKLKYPLPTTEAIQQFISQPDAISNVSRISHFDHLSRSHEGAQWGSKCLSENGNNSRHLSARNSFLVEEVSIGSDTFEETSNTIFDTQTIQQTEECHTNTEIIRITSAGQEIVNANEKRQEVSFTIPGFTNGCETDQLNTVLITHVEQSDSEDEQDYLHNLYAEDAEIIL